MILYGIYRLAMKKFYGQLLLIKSNYIIIILFRNVILYCFYSLKVYGMENIPEEDLIEHEKQNSLNFGRADDATQLTYRIIMITEKEKHTQD